MNKSTQNWFEDELSKIDKSFHTLLDTRTEKTKERLSQLSDRIDKLDQRFEVEKTQILKTIDERGEELRAMLERFKEEFEIDRRLRLEREEKIKLQLTEHEHEVSGKFEYQLQMREARYQAVRKVLEENVKLREKAGQLSLSSFLNSLYHFFYNHTVNTEERFQQFFEREVHKLYNDVSIETEIREREDDEIVEALNRYTVKLQASLKIINSTDM